MQFLRSYQPTKKVKEQLTYAAEQVNSIEINGTFYGLKKPKDFLLWAEMTPDDFVFAVKAPRYITHIKKLKDVEKPVANFMASGLMGLGSKLGAILWQLPPDQHFEASRMEAFLGLLPHTSEDMLAVANQHDGKVEGRSYLESPERFKVRHAIEIRNPSFACPEFLSMLERYKIAAVIADSSGMWPFLEETTAPYVYARMHGMGEAYSSGYPRPDLCHWAEKILQIGGDCDEVFVYFDNEAKVQAPFNAIDFAKILGDKVGSSHV